MIYLTVEDVVLVHAEVVGCSDHDAAQRLLRLSALEGALARPLWYARFVDPEIPFLAAVLAHSLADGQVFIDGNKRTLFLAMAVLLDRNGYELNADDVDLARWIIDLSRGSSIEELAARLSSVVARKDG